MPIQYTLAQEIVVETVREYVEANGGAFPKEVHIDINVWKALDREMRDKTSVGAIEHGEQRMPAFTVVGVPIWIGSTTSLDGQLVRAFAEPAG